VRLRSSRRQASRLVRWSAAVPCRIALGGAHARRPELAPVNLVVSDMEATVAFYRSLGLTVPNTEPEWDQHHRSATMPGGIDLEFDSTQSVSTWNEGWPADRRGAVLGLSVATREAVDEKYADLTAAGATSQQPPFDTFWGSRYAVVEDPDGNAVGIMSPPEPERRQAPPEP
jgi:uncharacterized glyoxalase superfamily protein PhnB